MHSARSGFTLIEILVVVAVTMLLSTFILLYSTTGRAQVALFQETSKMAQVIARAKTLTLSTYATGGAACGYGVSWNPGARQYSLVSWKAPDCSQIISVPVTTVVQTFTMNSTLILGNGANELSQVYFVPPDPQTVLDVNGAIETDQTGNIYLQTGDGSANHTISVNSVGQINF